MNLRQLYWILFYGVDPDEEQARSYAADARLDELNKSEIERGRCRYCGVLYQANPEKCEVLRCPSCGAPGTESNMIKGEVSSGYTGIGAGGYDISASIYRQS